VTIIPQDPTLFTGSLKFNIDPEENATDEEILELLDRAGLTHLTTRETNRSKGKSSPKKNGDTQEKSTSDLLSFNIIEGGENLSSGEKSLICICRAVLRKNKIVILDEATANIDLITEQKIQKLISEEFKDCTVLTIAHRLQTIIESDNILVLDNG
jgi:ABC-type multidrug transport system fused ATPase/permease subunit